jgi:hypothetical protein
MQDLADLNDANKFLAGFSPTAAVGFGICDRNLRYQSINRTLAVSNGVSVEAHLGNTVRDVLGEVAVSVEPAFQRVWATNEIVSRQIAGRLPATAGVVHWIANYFPLKTADNRTRHMGVVAAEVTELKILDQFFRTLTHELVGSGNQESLRIARDVCDSIDQYFAALTTSLGRLARDKWQLDQSADEQLAPTIELLDKRISDMRKLTCALAESRAAD